MEDTFGEPIHRARGEDISHTPGFECSFASTHAFQRSHIRLSHFHIVVMITKNDLSLEILAINIPTTIKSSLDYSRKLLCDC